MVEDVLLVSSCRDCAGGGIRRLREAKTEGTELFEGFVLLLEAVVFVLVLVLVLLFLLLVVVVVVVVGGGVLGLGGGGGGVLGSWWWWWRSLLNTLKCSIFCESLKCCIAHGQICPPQLNAGGGVQQDSTVAIRTKSQGCHGFANA